MGNIYKKLFNNRGAQFARVKVLAGSLLFVLSLVSSALGAYGSPAASATPGPTYSANAVLGQNDLNSAVPDEAGTTNSGFDEPYGVALDSVHHRLFVAEEDNSRVDVYNLDSSNHLIDKTADFVLGQSNFHGEFCGDDSEGGVTASTECEPQDLAYDSVHDRLFVADTDENRVLIYDTATITNGEAATHELGQTDMNAEGCTNLTTAATLCDPAGVAYDSARNYLYVADTNNGRVLVFDVSSVTDGQNAINELGYDGGQSWTFTSGGSDRSCPGDDADFENSFCFPQRLAYDSTNHRLFVSDNGDYRIMDFNVATITNGQDAVHVLGQDQLSFIGNDGGTVSASRIADARGLAYDAANNRLFVGDAGSSGGNRVLVFDANPSTIADGEDASNELGQANFFDSCQNRCDSPAANTLSGPYGLAYDSGNNQLWVADSFNNRLVNYDVSNITDGEDASDVLGQSDFSGDYEDGISVPNSMGLDGPTSTVIDSVDHHLYVADGYNDRVLVFNLNSDNSIGDKTADYVLGAADMTTDGCNDDDSPSTDLCFPDGLAIDTANHVLYVSDRYDHRILMYDLNSQNVPTDDTPDYVLGQADSTSDNCNQGNDGPSADSMCDPAGLSLDTVSHHLYVGDTDNNRVLVFNLSSSDVPVDTTADYVIGNTDFDGTTDCTDGSTCLDEPFGVTVDTSSHLLYVGDSFNSRVLIYNLNNQNVPTDTTPDYILGQPGPNDTDCNQGDGATESTLCDPSGIIIDPAGHRMFVSDSDNSRVLVFDLASDGFPVDQAADGIIGQTDYENGNCNNGMGDPVTASTLCGPTEAYDDPEMAYDPDSGLLFVPDTFNRRVLSYQVGASGEVVNTDNDNDGITNATEDSAPNDGDANGDGIADSTQGNVTSFVDPVTGKYASLQSTCTDNNSVSLAAAGSESTKDGAFNYPAGLMSFNLTCPTGSTATINQYFYGTFNASLIVARKYNPSNHTYTTIPGATTQATTIGGQAVLRVTYSIKDGGSLDQDGSANGTIIDPSGPALNSATAPNTGGGATASNVFWLLRRS